MNSTRKVEVIRITEVLPHPNADRLEIIPVWAYTCCVRVGQFNAGDLAAYLPPDSMVDTNRPEFTFLNRDDGKPITRIKAQKLRGVWSQGLLIEAPDGSTEGDDVAEILNVSHYEPPESFVIAGDQETDTVYSPKYDVDSAYRYADLIMPGEYIVATEKIHGTNARYTFKDGIMHCGSHNTWKKENKDNLYWKMINQYPAIKEFCVQNPGYILCGEIYGMQSLKYGLCNGHSAFAAFDAMYPNFMFMDYSDCRDKLSGFDIPIVPTLYEGPFDFQAMVELSMGQSVIPGANHIREGIVVTPVIRRQSLEIGDVKLKFVSPQYLSKE